MKTGSAKATLLLIGLLSSLVGALVCRPALAVEVTYKFTSTVSSINPSATGFPTSLNGVKVNDPISGTVQYDAASPAATNTQGSVYALATYYPLTHVSVSINVAGVIFNTWTGTISAFVWNDDPISPPATNDGFLFVNITSITDARFKIGNLLLPTSTFSNESLPSGPVTGSHFTELGTPNSIWLDSGIYSLVQVTSVVGDYDSDGSVTQLDYQVWRTHFGSTSSLAADGNGNGVIDAADYIVWRNAIGHGAGSGTIASEAIPEPTTVGLLITAGAVAFLLRATISR